MLRLAALLLLTSCVRLPPGEPCEATGDGFARRDPCSFTCVEWEVPCDDGSSVVPGICSAGGCSSDEDCDAGFACARTGSVSGSCLPDDLCGEAGFSLDAPPLLSPDDSRLIEGSEG